MQKITQIKKARASLLAFLKIKIKNTFERYFFINHFET